MMMMPRLWPGRRIESVDDYAGVLVALEDAHLHSHTYRLRRRAGFAESLVLGDDAASDDCVEGVVKVGSEDEGTAMLDMSVPEYSIEGLRREVRRGAKGEKWTAYESEEPFLFPCKVMGLHSV